MASIVEEPQIATIMLGKNRLVIGRSVHSGRQFLDRMVAELHTLLESKRPRDRANALRAITALQAIYEAEWPAKREVRHEVALRKVQRSQL